MVTLAEQHFPWAERLARTFAWTQPRLDADDAVGIAAVTLVECEQRFQPGRASFRTYAAKRVLGRLRDEVRERRKSYPVIVPLDGAAELAVLDRAAESDARVDALKVLRSEPEFVARRALLVASGMTLVQAARYEGVTASAVCLSVRRAARALRAAA